MSNFYYEYLSKLGLTNTNNISNESGNEIISKESLNPDELFEPDVIASIDTLNSNEDIQEHYQTMINKIAEDLKIIKPSTISEQEKLDLELEIEGLKEQLKSADDTMFGFVDSETNEVIGKNTEYIYNSSQITEENKVALIEHLNTYTNSDTTKLVETLLEDIGEIKASIGHEVEGSDIEPQVYEVLQSKIENQIRTTFDNLIENNSYTNEVGEKLTVQELLPEGYFTEKSDVAYLDDNQQSVLTKAILKSHKTESNFSALHNILKELKNDFIDVGKDVSNLNVESYTKIAKAVLSELEANDVQSELTDKVTDAITAFEESIKNGDVDPATIGQKIYDLQVNALNLDEGTDTYIDFLKDAKRGKVFVSREKIAEILPDTVILDDGTKAIVDDEIIDYAYAQVVTSTQPSKEIIAAIINDDKSINEENKEQLIEVLWQNHQAEKMEDNRDLLIKEISTNLIGNQKSNENIAIVQNEILNTISEITSRQIDNHHLAANEASFGIIDLDYIEAALKKAYTEDHGPGCTCWIHSDSTRTKASEMADAVKNSILDYQNTVGTFDANLKPGESVESFVKNMIMNTDKLESSCGSDKESLVEKFLFNSDEYDTNSLLQNVEYKGTLELRHMKNTQDTESMTYKMKEFILDEVNNGENIISDGVAQYLTEVSAAIIEQYNINSPQESLEQYFVENMNSYLNPDKVNGTVFYENFGAVLDFTEGNAISEKIANSDIFNSLANKVEEFNDIEMKLLEKTSTLEVVTNINENEYQSRLKAIDTIKKIAQDKNINLDFSAIENIINSDSNADTEIIEQHFSELYKNKLSKNIVQNQETSETVDFSELKTDNFFNEIADEPETTKTTKTTVNANIFTKGNTGQTVYSTKIEANKTPSLKEITTENTTKADTKNNLETKDEIELNSTSEKDFSFNLTQDKTEYETMLDDLIWKNGIRRLTSTERYGILDSIDDSQDTSTIKRQLNKKLSEIDSDKT